jgi:structure-specific endonuclease subunit SLX1
MDRHFYVYFLESTGGATYIGATVDLDHRLRQHNGELKGGARATSAKVGLGETWRRVGYVSGFPDWIAALQFEWRWKQITRKLPKRMPPHERRVVALQTLLGLDQATSKAVPFALWPGGPPDVHWECESL